MTKVQVILWSVGVGHYKQKHNYHHPLRLCPPGISLPTIALLNHHLGNTLYSKTPTDLNCLWSRSYGHFARHLHIDERDSASYT